MIKTEEFELLAQW